MNNLTQKIYLNSLSRYLFVGGSSYVLDLGILSLLFGVVDINIAISASIAFWVAVIYNFIATRYWTFSARQNHQLSKHIVLYLLLLGLNYTITVTVLWLTRNTLNYALVKTALVVLQVLWNYPIYKFVIFKK